MHTCMHVNDELYTHDAHTRTQIYSTNQRQYHQHTQMSKKPSVLDIEDAMENERIHVPVHLAINQCVISTVKDQFKVVNRCMLHMMYRKLNLLRHLKALKVFYLSGQGDIMETFAQQLFHSNQECTLKDNSLYFFNNSSLFVSFVFHIEGQSGIGGSACSSAISCSRQLNGNSVVPAG